MSQLHWIASRKPRAQLETGVRSSSTGAIRLSLYVAGLNPRSTRAIADLRRLCQEHLPGRCDVEIIDIYQQPKRAVEAQIVAVPTLIRSAPPPHLRVIGTLSESKSVLKHLGLVA